MDLKYRDSKCLNQAMDSRFRGNDVISVRRIAFRLAVIPAMLVPEKAGSGNPFRSANPET